MKRIVALILMMCLMGASVAFADQSVEGTVQSMPSMRITYKVNSYFNVVIPSEIVLDESNFSIADNGGTRQAEFDVTVKGGGVMEEGKAFCMSVEPLLNDFMLRSEGGAISYTVCGDWGTVNSSTSSTTSVSPIFYLESMPAEDVSETVCVQLDGFPSQAGTYVGSLNFYIEFCKKQ